MKIKVEAMAEIVRAYAIKVNVHKSVQVVADISDWAYHYILNMYYEKQEKSEDWSDLAMRDEEECSKVTHTRDELYKEAMIAYKKVAA